MINSLSISAVIAPVYSLCTIADWSYVFVLNGCETKRFIRNKWGSVEIHCLTLLMSTEETLLNLDFDKPNTVITPPDDGVVSLSSSSEEICLVPEVGFEGNVDSPGVNRESQPLLGGRGDFEVSFNHFPGETKIWPL